MTRRTRHVSFWLAGFAATLTLVEILLRFAMGNVAVVRLFQVDPPDGRCVGLRADAQVIYTGLFLAIPPVTLDVNREGYRGPVVPRGSADALLRVAFVGDSMTYGQGVRWDETLPHFAGEAVAERSDQPAHVMNFGIPGLGAPDYREHYARYVRLWNPALVVLVVVENDLDGSICDVVQSGLVRVLFRASYAFRMLVVLKDVGKTLVRAVFFGEHDAEREAARLGRHLEELRTEVQRRGAELVSVVLGDPITLKGGRWATALEDVMDASGIRWLDLRGNSFPRILGDGHFTPDGNREAARAIADWLVGEGILVAGAESRRR